MEEKPFSMEMPDTTVSLMSFVSWQKGYDVHWTAV